MYREPAKLLGRCPRCSRALQPIEVAKIKYQRCRCGGAFVDVAAFHRMWGVMANLSSAITRPPQLRARPAIYSLQCPMCTGGMERVDILGVPVDHCQTDGLWFDDPELTTILMAAKLPFHEWLRSFAARIRDMK